MSIFNSNPSSHRSFRCTVIIMCLQMLCCIGATAQSEMAIPEISPEELLMTQYPQDSSAVAVCLNSMDETRIYFADGFSMRKSRTIFKRIKILKEEGKEYANFSLVLDVRSDSYEGLDSYSVTTYTQRDGKVEKVRMSPKYLFRSPLSSGLEKVSFTAEKVEVGSVIDFCFFITTDAWYNIKDVVLQMDIPVLKAVACVEYPSSTTWNKMSYGYRKLQYSQSTTSKTINTGNGLASRLSLMIITDKYSLDHIEAFREESFCWYPEKFRSSISYDLSEYYSFYKADVVKVQSSWEEVDKRFREMAFFKAIKGKSPFAKELDGISRDKTLSESEKIISVIKFVRNAVKWNGNISSSLFYSSSTLAEIKKAVKEGTGSNVVINCLTASALTSVGIKCSPVMITYRDEGSIADFHASVNSFDTFILCAETSEGKRYFFDASLGNSYLNTLPPVQLSEKARLIPLEGSGSWVNLSGLGKGSEQYDVEMAVDPDGTIRGNVNFTGSVCSCYDFKDSYAAAADLQQFTNSFFNSDDYRFEGLQTPDIQDYSNFFGASASFSGDASSGSNLLYVNPFIKVFHNPLDMPEGQRNCDIELPYCKSIAYKCHIRIPQGYVVKSLPEERSQDQMHCS